MKKIFLFLMLLSGVYRQGWSHEAPVPVNHMRWAVDAGVLRVHLHANAPWWGLNIFGDRVPPPTNWPVDLQKLAKDYLDRHFIVRADGKVLASHMVSYRYSDEFWRTLGAQLDLDFYYALPSSVKTISGQALFYKEAKDDRDEGEKLLPKPRFETYLKISGAPAHSMLLTLDHPDFSFAFGDIVRSAAQRWRDACVDGLTCWKTAPWLVLAFCAFQLQWRARAIKTAYYGGLIGAAMFSAGFLSRCHPGNLLSGVYPALAVVDPGLQSAGMTDWVGYGVGIFVALLGVALVVNSGLSVYQQRLQKVSESQAELLFTSQIRFVSLLLGGMALFLLAQRIQTPV